MQTLRIEFDIYLWQGINLCSFKIEFAVGTKVVILRQVVVFVWVSKAIFRSYFVFFKLIQISWIWDNPGADE